MRCPKLVASCRLRLLHLKAESIFLVSLPTDLQRRILSIHSYLKDMVFTVTPCTGPMKID